MTGAHMDEHVQESGKSRMTEVVLDVWRDRFTDLDKKLVEEVARLLLDEPPGTSALESALERLIDDASRSFSPLPGPTEGREATE